MRVSPLVLAALAPISWGVTYYAAARLAPMGPLTLATLRALPAALLLLLLARRLPQGAWWWRSAALGTLNVGLFFGLLYVGIVRLPGGVAATIGAVTPLFVALLSVPLLGQTVRRHELLAGVVGLLGVALLVLGPGAKVDMLGVLAALASTLCAALGMVLSARWGTPPGASQLTVTSWQLGWGGLLLLPLMLWQEGQPQLTGLGAEGWLWLGFASLIATALVYVVWFGSLQRVPAVQISLLSRLTPVTAVLIDLLVLHVHLTPWQWLGLGVVALSFVLGLPKGEKQKTPSIAEGENQSNEI